MTALVYGKPLQYEPALTPGVRISTKIPKDIFIIRSIATAALAALVAFKTTSRIVRFSSLLAGAAFIGYTASKYLRGFDPLVLTLYKMVGDKRKFDALPEAPWKGRETVSENLQRLKWDRLEHSVYRFKTTDGRQGAIVKAVSHTDKTQSVFTFVEKLHPRDFPALIPIWAKSLLQAVGLIGLSHTYNLGMNLQGKTEDRIYSYFDTDLFNQFYEQMVICPSLT